MLPRFPFRLALLLLGSTWAGLALPSTAHAAAQFEPLGDLEGGLERSEVLGISADGSTVVGKSSGPGFFGSGNANHAVRWTAAAGVESLGTLSGFLILGEALAANEDGSVVVGNSVSDVSQGLEAFRWTQETGMVGLGFLWVNENETGLDSQGAVVSHDGSVVGGKSKPGPDETDPPNSPGEAYLWTAGTGMEGLGDLPGGNLFNSRAVAMSADASIVTGFSVSSDGTNTFLWTHEGGMVQGVGLPGGATFSEARGISADGEVIVGFASSSRSSGDTADCSGRPVGERPKVEAYLEDGATSTALGDLPGGCFNSLAFDATSDGSVVVGYSDTALNDEAFLWDAEHGMRNFRQLLIDDHGLGKDLAGWVLLEARAISDDGEVIAGTGLNPAGDLQGWLVRLPEPQAVLQAGFALTAIAAVSWRRRRS